jgi:glyoxylase-like metal-dependent hydrolase (beta-lactamase superfamily II)
MSNENIKILQLPLGPLQTNCYLLGCQETKQAAVIDPSWSGKLIAEKAEEEGWSISHVLLTHSHFDHVAGLAELREQTLAPIFIHPDAIPMLENAELAAGMWQIRIDKPPLPDRMLDDKQEISVGNVTLRVLFTPGHAPGHVCFYLAEHNVVFDGDALFQQSIGRTNLPGGDYHLLMRSIRQQLLVLPDETTVLSGHGPATTIGQEKSRNPFLS